MRRGRIKSAFALIVAASLLTTTGCTKKEAEVEPKQESKPVISEYEIPVDNTYFYNKCVYGDRLFYEVYYGDSAVDQTNGKKLMDSDDTDTEIHCYDMSDKKDTTVYRIGGGFVKTEYMSANSKYVFWETADDNGWQIYYMDYKSGGSPKILMEQKASKTLSDICFTVTDDAIYWYDVSDDGEAAIWRRKFENSKNEKFAGNVSLLSPYEQPQIVDDQIGYIEKSGKGNALVVKNTDGKETLRKSIDTTGGGVIANSSWCVWEKDDNPSSTIYLYDRKSGKIDTYDLGKNQFYSYALSGDYLIINTEAGSDSDDSDMASMQ